MGGETFKALLINILKLSLSKTQTFIEAVVHKLKKGRQIPHSLSTSSLAVHVDLPTLLMATQAYWPASSG